MTLWVVSAAFTLAVVQWVIYLRCFLVCWWAR